MKLISKITSKFKENPKNYYAVSVCATWAGIGSLMNGVAMTQTYGAIPSAIWVFGNVIACAVFGWVVTVLPEVRKVFETKIMRYICATMCVFQAWLSMNGVETIFRDTPLGGTFGKIVAYATAVIFLILLLKFGMIRNVLTDGFGWAIVYVLVCVVTVSAFAFSKGAYNQIGLGLELENMKQGIYKAILLIPGPFTYPYFFEILDYNEKNYDGTTMVKNVKQIFTVGGLLFGIYMLIVFPLAWVSFNPALSILKAVLITIIGTSTLSSSMYSIYIVFGKKIGCAINTFMIAFWAVLVPLGVMNMWTLMASIRIYFVTAGILYALYKRHEKHSKKQTL